MEQRSTLAIMGAGGVLGAKLVEQALPRMDGTIYAYTHGATPAIPAATSSRVVWAQLDIADAAAVVEALNRARPTTVINAAAMTNVDACEDQRDVALAANGAGPRHLAQACVRLSARLIHVSTDYVFPGDDAHPGPYLEDAPVRPVNYYGATKLAGEQAIQAVCGDQIPWLIARTALVYGHLPGGRTNFVRWLVGKLQAGDRVAIVNDQFNTPTLADDLATALLALVPRGTRGVIHLAGPDLLSREQWARAVAAHF
ncbi:MAG TPA: NAD(P)-dependent oxidoreductase, partial [Ktedonobacterales bacterium]|nr:NAD(P)-dependent oxidoreductase [Ktedonobacterales bacterium]